jgi:hypothetical protein
VIKRLHMMDPMNQPMSPGKRSLFVLRGLAPALAAVLAAGCGGGNDAATTSTLYPVKGSVVLESGKPVSGGRVVFVSANGMSSFTGTLGPDGSYTLKTGDAEGAPAGDYKVRIEADTTGKATRGSTLPFAKKYLDEDGSELKATVKPEPNTIPAFKLSNKESAPAGRGARDRD